MTSTATAAATRATRASPRYEIWADSDDDGIRDSMERFAVTDSERQYVINDIRPPDGTYMLRETLLTYRPRAMERGAGKAYRPVATPVSEAAVTGTNPANYRSTVGRKVGTRRSQVRSGGVYANLELSSGECAVCTFRNVHIAAPAIGIDKTGPATAVVGETLRYTPLRHEPGLCLLPRRFRPCHRSKLRRSSRARRERPRCHTKNARPRRHVDLKLVAEDLGGGRLHAIRRAQHRHRHWEAGGASVSDAASIETSLTCPPTPRAPQTPAPPSPLVPPGPKPPDAGDAAQRASSCVRRREGASAVGFRA
jgi:hypothetical protein